MKSATVTRTFKRGRMRFRIRVPRKALSVKQPWASLIAWKAKTLEVRSWRTKYRGPLTIVSSQSPEYPQKMILEMEEESGMAFPNGVAICTANLVDVRPGKKSDKKTALCDPTGQFVWVLEDVVHVLHNFPVKGRLGIFDLK